MTYDPLATTTFVYLQINVFGWDLEAWSFAATIWGGFGTLALLPIIQIVRHRRQSGIDAKKSIQERLEDLCERLGIVEITVKENTDEIARLDDKMNNVTTDVRVLEALEEDHKFGQPNNDTPQERREDFKRRRRLRD